MKEEYREKIAQIVSEIEDERGLWLILCFARSMARRSSTRNNADS